MPRATRSETDESQAFWILTLPRVNDPCEVSLAGDERSHDRSPPSQDDTSMAGSDGSKAIDFNP